MATFTQESIQEVIDNGEDAFIEIPSTLNNDGLAQIRTAMMRLAASETVENQVAGILNETIQVNSGATLQFRNSTGSTVTFTGTWEGAGAVDVQTFTSAGVINVAGTINLAGGISHTGGVTGKLRIGNNVGTNGNVPISVGTGSTGNTQPLEFYYASTDQAEPVINGTITGGHSSKYIAYNGRITLHGNHRNNSNLKNLFENTHQVSYTNHLSIMNPSFTATNTDYHRYDGGVTIYRGTGGYTHPSGLNIRGTANGAYIVNRGITAVNPVSGGKYSDQITFGCDFSVEGTDPEILFSGHEDHNIRFNGHKAFRFEGDIDLGTTGDIIQQYGTTFNQEGVTATSQNITCREMFINGDFRVNARIICNTQIRGTGRLIPGIRFGEPVTFLGNLSLLPGATIVTTVGEDDIDNVLVLGSTTFPPDNTGSINVQVIVAGESSAANLPNVTRNIIFCNGGLVNLSSSQVSTSDTSKVQILPYNGTEAENKSVIDPTNAHYPTITNDNFAPTLVGTTLALAITDKV